MANYDRNVAIKFIFDKIGLAEYIIEDILNCHDEYLMEIGLLKIMDEKD